MDRIFLEKVYDIFQIPLLAYDGQDTFEMPEDGKDLSFLASEQVIKKEISRVAAKQKEPFLFLENDLIYYGVFQWEKWLVIFGPISRHEISGGRKEAYRRQHRYRFSLDIRHVGIGITAKMLTMLYYYYSYENIQSHDIPIINASDEIGKWTSEQEVETYQLEQSEYDRGHDSAEYENRIRQIVRDGDLEGMQQLLHADRFDVSNIGIMSGNDLKQMEYMIVTMIVMVSRAAIEGGLNPEEAYQLSDVYMQKLSQCKSIDDMSMIGLKAQVEYTKKVRLAKEQRSKFIYIEECKDYIAKNLRKPFKVGDIAPAIGVNRSYLARKFSEVEGITIQQYIMKERCSHAANLLKYSKYPISIISEYFCFSSQSHFGKQFKQFYGVTPNEYRNQHRYIESYSKEK